MAETSNEKNFFETTYDKVSDFMQPNKVEADASFKDTFNKAIENGIITKEELDALMTRFDNDKNNLGEKTKGQLDNLRKEAVIGMLKNGFDIRNSKDISNLKKFLPGIPELGMSPNLLLKIENLNKFYEGTNKSGFDGAVDRTLDVLKVKDITLTLNEKNEIVEMGILDLNNPLNDNESEVDKTKYNLGEAISVDEKAKKEAEDAEKAKQVSPEEIKKEEIIIASTRTSNVEKAKEEAKNTKTDKKEDSEKHKSALDKAKEYNSKYSKDQIRTIQMVLGMSNQTGNFGPKTFAAVEDFQRKNKLKVDGMVGPKTQSEMGISL